MMDMYEKSKSNWFGKAPKKLNLSFIDSVGESRFNFLLLFLCQMWETEDVLMDIADVQTEDHLKSESLS